MKTYTFPGDYNTAKLRSELLDAGIPDEWWESGDRYVLIVQQHEDAAVAIDEPILDADYNLIFENGQPKTEIVWKRLDTGEEIKPAKKLIPADPKQGMHIQIGPGFVLVQVPNGVTEAKVKSIAQAHDSTPAEPEPTLEERVAILEEQLAESKK